MNTFFKHLRRVWRPCLLTAFMAAALAVQAADGNDIASVAWDNEIRVTSDLRNRGISDSLNGPAVKLTLQAAHETGFVGLVELASVSKKQFLDGAGVSITAGAGYRFGDPDAWHFGLGIAGEWFPGASFEAPHAIDLTSFTPVDVRRTRYDSQFLVLEAGHGALEARALIVLSKTYRGANTGGVCGQMLQVSADPSAALACYGRGDFNSRGTLLLDLNYRIELDPQTTLKLHGGLQRIRNFKEGDVTDVAIGVEHRRWGFNFGADLVATDARVRELYLVPDGSRLRATDGTKLVLSVARKF